MSAINKLLDKARNTRHITSDMALAARLDKSRALVSAWRKGEKHVQDDDVARLAELAKVDPGSWLVAIRAEQSSGAAHTHWAKLAKRLGVAATVAAVTLTGWLPSPAQASVSDNLNGSTLYALCEVVRMWARKLQHCLIWSGSHGTTALLA